MDLKHGIFLHASSHTMVQGESTATFVTRDTQHGCFSDKAHQRDVNFY